MKIYKRLFEKIVSAENLFTAWDAFKSDKKMKKDVLQFEWRLEENIFKLTRELKAKTYRHGVYSGFYITDPKRRHIHKAEVRDRILHHAVFNILNPIFEETFISASFSCRVGFGTHKGVNALERITRRVSQNGTKVCYVLKCDIRKFFDSVDHKILMGILEKRIKDPDTIWLLREIVRSFDSENSSASRVGVPIGNLTSQSFANIYMNEFDQFMKHELRIENYLRYTDDFVIISRDETYLQALIPQVSKFLRERLALELHPKKVFIRKLHQGIDFLGYLVFPNDTLVKTRTKRRIFAKLKRRVKEYRKGEIERITLDQSLQSYLGMLSHADSYKLGEGLKNQFWFWLSR